MAGRDKTDETDGLLRSEEGSVSRVYYVAGCLPPRVNDAQACRYRLTRLNPAGGLPSFRLPRSTATTRQQHLHSARPADSRESTTLECFPYANLPAGDCDGNAPALDPVFWGSAGIPRKETRRRLSRSAQGKRALHASNRVAVWR